MALLRSIPASAVPDADLLARFRETRDMQVLGELYGRYLELVYGVCLKYLKQAEDAQDSTMLIFEELSVKLHRHEVDHFKSWLYTLAKNHCLMRIRSSKKALQVDFDVELVQSAEEPHLDGVKDREENFSKMEFCISRLPDDQKKMIELFYLDGRCYNEITAITGMDWKKVRSCIQNGRRNLRICMEKQKATLNERTVRS
ncbi:MAG TPA: sigma-70 family RNA polymerase sigma factor [Flavisolibacter sp.]